MSKRIHLLLVIMLVILAGLWTIRYVKSSDSPNMWVEPTHIFPGDTVTVHVRASWANTEITSMKVTSPGATIWWLLNTTTDTTTLSIILPDVDDEISITFPDGAYTIIKDPDGDVQPATDQIKWESGANSLQSGKYSVYAYGVEAVGEWDVSGYFYVPEFALPSMVLTVVGFALLNIKHKIKKKQLQQ